MHYFPQLESGAMGQYPLRRVRRLRTVRNQMADGREVRLADAAAIVTEWRLEAAWLTDGELERLAAFFEAVEGRLHTFTFLDPADNLLRWSEDLEESVWEKGPLVTVAGGVADPFGGMRGWRVANGSLAQRLMVPEWFYYTVSVYARCDGGGVLRLLRGSQSAQRRLTPEWKRLSFASQSDGTAESVRFGVETEPGAAVEIYGLQVEPQIAASAYKRTGQRGGVYPNARLAEDRLYWATVEAGRHACTVGIIHGEHF